MSVRAIRSHLQDPLPERVPAESGGRGGKFLGNGFVKSLIFGKGLTLSFRAFQRTTSPQLS